MDLPMKPNKERERCSEITKPTRIFGPGARCTRYAVRDGYCKQHHPDAVKAREEAAESRYAERSRAFYEREKQAVVLALGRATTEQLRAELKRRGEE